MSKIQKAAITTGISLLLMTILSIVIFSSLDASTFSIAGIAIIIILDVIVAITLYQVLKPVNNNLSKLTAVFRIVYAVIFTIALVKMPDLNSFTYILERGLIVFGFHLLLLGLLIFKSVYIPKWLGALVAIAGIGYIVDSIGVFWGYTFNIAIYTFVGELILMLWLLIKGKNFQIPK